MARKMLSLMLGALASRATTFTSYSRPLAFSAGGIRSAARFRYVTLPAEGQRVGELLSVSGNIYTTDEKDAPVVTLFTKKGCTLCDKVTEVCTFLIEIFPGNVGNNQQLLAVALSCTHRDNRC